MSEIALDPAPFVHREDDGIASLTVLVDGIHCAGCVQRIERTLAGVPGVVTARGNLSTRRFRLRWRDDQASAADLIARIAALGYGATPFVERADGDSAATNRRLLRALAVSGFAAANVMLLSVAVWSGAVSDMDEVTRGLFHWISALIVLPAAAYSVRPFAGPALRQLSRGQVGMDLPITVAVVLTLGLSIAETYRGGPHVYFDAAIMLLFFLLIGRTLDHQARARAGRLAENLLVLRGMEATVIDADGRQRAVAVSALAPGMRVLVAAGGRIAADGSVESGRSDVDTSLVTGESVPVAVAPGAEVLAGTLNLTAPIVVTVRAAGEDTVLAEIARLIDTAGQGRGAYVRLADRMARIYAPMVHIAALATFLLWWGWLGAEWQAALIVAVSVLIITCPCALGLAVPVVQVVANGRLLAEGVIVKSADGLERLAEVDTVIFDKTGTLTTGALVLRDADGISPDDLAFAAMLAGASRHPICRALHAAAGHPAAAGGVREHPGDGLSLALGEGEARLGRHAWAVGGEGAAAQGPELWLSRPGHAPVAFRFDDSLRRDAAETVQALRRMGLAVELLSGDREETVARAARDSGIDVWRSGARPADKLAHLSRLAGEGRKVLMVGDGLNDAPALAAAHASISPAAAADVSQAAADLVFQGAALGPVAHGIAVARRARALARGNFALAFAYNVFAVPVAMAGLVTPLIAAAAMSASSVLVTANALRLGLGRKAK
jgi:Cu2+-exporting ATPase